VRLRLIEVGETGVVVRRRGIGELVIPYEEILTVERIRSRRGLDVHTRMEMEPFRVRCRGSRRERVESELRFMGVRIVDCSGAIIAPTLRDFEDELARHPTNVRQSYDDG
jgi:hypothetical protein